MNRLHQVRRLGQSIWYDNIRRSLIDSGELQGLIDLGVTGVTSNPSIFKKAIVDSDDYDQSIRDLLKENLSVEDIYESLALDDIRRAADLFRAVYDAEEGRDGYVSLEVSPHLAHDSAGTIEQARRLHAALDRPNVMIKVPATPAGIEAIPVLIGGGININVTLMFGLDAYRRVAEAYLKGLETFGENGGDLSRVASVASFFVSRLDAALEEELEAQGAPDLKDKIAIANARMAYAAFDDIFAGPRFKRLQDQGARSQRVLWASTSTKNPDFPDTLYMDALIGPQTVNTVPPQTLQAFLDHGSAEPRLREGTEESRRHLDRLAALGIDLNGVTDRLLQAGVESFARSFVQLMEGLKAEAQRLSAKEVLQVSPAGMGPAWRKALQDIRDQEIMQRIRRHDHTVWSDSPQEIVNRLGWLRSPFDLSSGLQRICTLRDDVLADGYNQVLVMGMGGSSLAPELFAEVFGSQVEEGLPLSILDTTDADVIAAWAERLDLSRTLFVVSSKSGTTEETLSAFRFFFNRALEHCGADQAGRHFVAVTDPGSSLVDLAERHSFRRVFLNDSNIGGRYSVLSFFGMVPAGLVGLDLQRFLAVAQGMAGADDAGGNTRGGDNAGPPASACERAAACLGALLGECAKLGRDKLTLFASDELRSFGDWVEQLIAESTGKDGQGIVPVVGETPGQADAYGSDRVFVLLRLEGDESFDSLLVQLEDGGHPIAVIRLKDRYDLAGQFFLWELATAVAAARLGINPFDQPNVESAKKQARKMVEEYKNQGRLPQAENAPLSRESLERFLSQALAGDYLALQAYLPPSRDNAEILDRIRLDVRDRLGLATTLGYGPRFLHSTGQLHKGDGGNGLFVQLVSDPTEDVPIPDRIGSDESSMTFGVLKKAQALGDARALQEAGRRLIRFDLGADATASLRRLQPEKIPTGATIKE